MSFIDLLWTLNEVTYVRPLTLSIDQGIEITIITPRPSSVVQPLPLTHSPAPASLILPLAASERQHSWTSAHLVCQQAFLISRYKQRLPVWKQRAPAGKCRHLVTGNGVFGRKWGFPGFPASSVGKGTRLPNHCYDEKCESCILSFDIMSFLWQLQFHLMWSLSLLRLFPEFFCRFAVFMGLLSRPQHCYKNEEMHV